jgi:hypothetical protein
MVHEGALVQEVAATVSVAADDFEYVAVKNMRTVSEMVFQVGVAAGNILVTYLAIVVSFEHSGRARRCCRHFSVVEEERDLEAGERYP